MTAIGVILSRNRGEPKRNERRTGKDVVKVLANDSSVAVHAESHVAWILLVGGNNFFSGRTCDFDVHFWGASQSGRTTTPEECREFATIVPRSVFK